MYTENYGRNTRDESVQTQEMRGGDKRSWVGGGVKNAQKGILIFRGVPTYSHTCVRIHRYMYVLYERLTKATHEELQYRHEENAGKEMKKAER